MKQSYEMVEFLSEEKFWSLAKSNKNHIYTMQSVIMGSVLQGF